jgi:hypothetical protein
VNHTVRIFVVPPPPSGAAPRPAPALVIDATSLDAARAMARRQLEGSGRRVRSLNFSGTGLIAYVEELAG